MNCPYCGKEISGVYFSTVCPSCNKCLHSCKCCKHYHQGSHYDCMEDVDELVTDKSRNNFCSYFTITCKQIKNGGQNDCSKKELLDRLFNI